MSSVFLVPSFLSRIFSFWVCWCQNKLFYLFNFSSLLRFHIVKNRKQYMYCFLPFGFTNAIIFVINPCGSYSAFVLLDLKYPNSLHYDRSSWSELRYFNFKPKFGTMMASCSKFWWITNSSNLRRFILYKSLLVYQQLNF